MSAPRRVVTGHDAEGRSRVLADGPAPKSHSIVGATFHELWNTTESPASVAPTETREPTERRLMTPPGPNGTIIRIVDLEPRTRSVMHRTETIDYGIVLAGRVVLELDDGSQTALEAGDVVVQRGTNHAWANPGDESARMAFVLVDGRFSEGLKANLAIEPKLFDHVLDE